MKRMYLGRKTLDFLCGGAHQHHRSETVTSHLIRGHRGKTCGDQSEFSLKWNIRKMRMVFYFTLILSAARCSDPMMETRTVAVGSDVKLSCARESSGSVFWIRLVSGNVPEYLMKSNSFKSDRHITATQHFGTLDLHIEKARLSDSAVYCCFKTSKKDLTFLSVTDLRVEEPDSSAVAPSDPVRPGDAVTEETCPVPWDSEMKTCPGGHSVCCARAAPHRYEPPFNGNRVEEHEGNAEELSADKHVYSFFMKVGSPDAGSQYCAVAACEERFTANETQLDTEDGFWSFGDVFLGSVVVLSLNVAAVLIYVIKTNKCDYCNNEAAASLLENVPKGNFKRNEDAWTYSTAVFTVMKSGGRRRAEGAQRENIHAAAKASGSD